MQNTAANRRLVYEILAAAKEVNRAAAGRKISFVCVQEPEELQEAETPEEPEETEKTRADKYWDKLREIDDDFCVEVIYDSCKRYIPGS